MTQLITALAPVVLLFSVTRQVQGKGFLVARHNHSELEDSPATDGELRRDLRHAVSTASRCGYSHGSHIPPGAGEGTQQVLRHMWQALPHTKQNRIGAKSLCYLMQRYFIRSGLLIRDLQPGSTGVTDKPCRLVSLYAESVLQGGHELKDFSLDDATTMVAAIEDLLLHSDTELLEAVYGEMDVSLPDQVPHDTVKLILENYMVHWLMGHDEEGIQLLLENRSLLEEIFPHWGQLAGLAEGRVRSMAYSRAMVNVFASGYSFDEVQQIVGGITRSFGFFWQSECTRLKDLLLDLDTDKDGRVPLASFYNVGATSEWRLGESEAYLRELGVLDETSRWRGKQVIIPNYIQATSNCIVSTAHYLVCCVQECETLLGEIEAAIGAPLASVSDLLPVVGNMTSQTTLDDDESPHLGDRLIGQLEEVAKTHGGMVPLHGRLFAQWLHYVFPRECPFPHKSGMVTSVTPDEYGQEHLVADEVMKKYARNATGSAIPTSIAKEELHWMSQWSPDEELIVDYSSEFGMPFERKMIIAIGGLVLIAGGIYGGVVSLGRKEVSKSGHWV
mmetsp:Transcript_109062/g.178020  ORF Transcript_109062/g.178020 Transcript_109062/m.178020 type:complete len:559 (+) Transcript_109062:53-1729(+)